MADSPSYEDTVRTIIDGAEDPGAGLRDAILWLAQAKDAENAGLAEQLREWQERDRATRSDRDG